MEVRWKWKIDLHLWKCLYTLMFSAFWWRWRWKYKKKQKELIHSPLAPIPKCLLPNDDSPLSADRWATWSPRWTLAKVPLQFLFFFSLQRYAEFLRIMWFNSKNTQYLIECIFWAIIWKSQWWYWQAKTTHRNFPEFAGTWKDDWWQILRFAQLLQKISLS